MVLGFRFDVEKAKSLLSELPEIDELDCQNEISQSLTKAAYASPAIRWLGVANNGKIICQSAQVGIKIDGMLTEHKQDNEWSFLASKTMGGSESLFLIHQRENAKYFADINPLQPNAISRFACNQCTSYSITIHGIDDLVISTSNTLDGPSVIHQVSSTTYGENKITLRVNASQSYLDYYRHFGWLVSFFISITIAVLVSFCIYRLLLARDSFEHLISEGLRKQQFIPFYQPVVDSRTGRLLGAEALVRWIGKNGKTIPPNEFIPFAEESGLILPITKQLSEQVAKDLKKFCWQDNELFISINLVPEHIYDEQFCDWLIKLIRTHDLKGKNLSVEITERRKLDDLEKGRKNLTLLVNAGINIKLDDAGTGYGGFSYVQELPIHTLKIDKMFIDTLGHEEDAKISVLNAIVNFAQNAELEIIAEGVESIDQVNRLADMGVFAIQGYVYGKPMNSADFIQWMASHQHILSE